MRINLSLFLLVMSVAVLGFQNCSNVGFSAGQNSSGGKPSDAGDEPTAFPGQTGVNGITGGHFDLDTSTQIYAAGKGTTNHHVHEYDKAHKTTTIDFFNLIDAKFNNIQSTIPSGQKFILNIVNASLSPGGVLDINGSLSGVAKYAAGPVYTIGPASGGAVPLSQFRLGFSPDVLANGGLVPTSTKCVRANDPGELGEYRNGALTIQALDPSNYSLDPATGAAASGLLWEATVFWHWNGGCY